MMKITEGMLRGQPRFIRGLAAGERGVVILIPEARLRYRGARESTLQPAAVIELHATGVTRHEIADPDQLLRRRLALAGLAVGAIGAALATLRRGR
jgi:hypothetical protein